MRLSLEKLAKMHTESYDALAEEYDQRAAQHQNIVNKAMARLAEYVPPGSRVLDIGCAVGNVTKALANLGYKAEGIDISPQMIERARQRAPEAKFIVGDVLHISTQRKYDASIAFAFIHLFPRQEIGTVFQRFHELAPGGIVYTGTTKETEYREGIEYKADYDDKKPRFRAHWPQEEMEQVFRENDFKVLKLYEHTDGVGKTWLDYIIKADRKQ